jgi:beta-glucosidase-like glycosyl hydrolase
MTHGRSAERELELDIGAVLLPEVRVGGTVVSTEEIVPSPEYLERFPPAGVLAFGRTPTGAVSPTKLLAAVRARCAQAGVPSPFACSDLEQGAGLHFAEGTRLPPALALSAAANGDKRSPEHGLRWIRSSGAITAREARALGVELVLAPVADVNTRRHNPIIAVRSFGDECGLAAERARAYLEGLHLGGAGGCAKHFPGHGDTSQDSHLELALVSRDEKGLREIELTPFRALIEAGVDCVMVGHLDVPSLTRARGMPASLSSLVVQECLRAELGFRGAVLSDAMNMGALSRDTRNYARALVAGCDGLLLPHHNGEAATALLRSVERGELPRERLAEAARSMRELRSSLFAREAKLANGDQLAPQAGEKADFAERAGFARELAGAALVTSPFPWPWKLGATCEIGMPFPETAGAEARAAVARLRERVAWGSTPAGVVIPVVCEVRAWAGGYGLSQGQFLELEERIRSYRSLGWPVGLCWFGSPQSLPSAWWEDPQLPILLAFAPTPPMFEAVGSWLEGQLRAGGSLPSALG